MNGHSPPSPARAHLGKRRGNPRGTCARSRAGRRGDPAGNPNGRAARGSPAVRGRDEPIGALPTNGHAKPSKPDPRNPLNDLTSTEWLPETISVWTQRGIGAGHADAQIERQHPPLCLRAKHPPSIYSHPAKRQKVTRKRTWTNGGDELCRAIASRVCARCRRVVLT